MATIKVVSKDNLSVYDSLSKARNNTVFQSQETGKGLSTNDYTNTEKSKLSAIAAGAQVNVLESIQVNGTAQTITNKSVNITVPTDNSQISNGAGYAKTTEVTSAIATAKEELEESITANITSAYKAKGSCAFADLPAASSTNEGHVYNITDAFTTTSNFVEGAGKTLPAGTNVVVVELKAATSTAAATYGYDALSGMVDLSAYAKTADFEELTADEISAIVNGTE